MAVQTKPRPLVSDNQMLRQALRVFLLFEVPHRVLCHKHSSSCGVYGFRGAKRAIFSPPLEKVIASQTSIIGPFSKVTRGRWPFIPVCNGGSENITSHLRSAMSNTLESMCILPLVIFLVASEVATSKWPRRPQLASELIYETSITYVSMFLLLLYATISLMTHTGEKPPRDQRR